MKRFAYLVLLLSLTGCTPTMNTVDRLTQQTLTIKGQQVIVDVATTPSQQQQGLSGREQLAEGTGMLFVFPVPAIQTFWMKDMQFPIDILWIADHRVIGIEPAVAADDGLRRYSSPFAVDEVLELPAGWVQRYSVRLGDEIRE